MDNPLGVAVVVLGTVIALSLAVVAACCVVATAIIWAGARRVLHAMERLERAADQAAAAAEEALRDVRDGARLAAGLLGGVGSWVPRLSRLRRLPHLVRAAGPYAAIVFGIWYLLGGRAGRGHRQGP